jgi:hypothetical protein
MLDLEKLAWRLNHQPLETTGATTMPYQFLDL